jgi:hypothetical protein
MTTAATTDAQIKLGITVTRNAGRKTAHKYTATYGAYPHDIWADGATALEARANLTAKIAVALATITEAKPRFARDEDGALWVAVPAHDGGSRWWRVTNDSACQNTSTCQPAAEAFSQCVGMSIIPNR